MKRGWMLIEHSTGYDPLLYWQLWHYDSSGEGRLDARQVAFALSRFQTEDLASPPSLCALLYCCWSRQPLCIAASSEFTDAPRHQSMQTPFFESLFSCSTSIVIAALFRYRGNTEHMFSGSKSNPHCMSVPCLKRTADTPRLVGSAVPHRNPSGSCMQRSLAIHSISSKRLLSPMIPAASFAIFVVVDPPVNFPRGDLSLILRRLYQLQAEPQLQFDGGAATSQDMIGLATLTIQPPFPNASVTTP